MLIALVIALIVLNAAFVMSEMALVSVRRGRLKARADRGSRGARAAMDLLDKPTRFLSTVQIGITLVGILLGAVGEEALSRRVQAWLANYPALVPYARPIAFGVTIGLLTYVSILLGELVPKRMAQAHPELLASIVARPMRLLSRLAAPAVALLTVSTELVLKFLPDKPAADDQGAEEEVKEILETGKQEGSIHEAEQRIVERVFRLGDLRVKALMVPRTDIDYLHLDDSPARIKVVIAAGSHSHLPVVRTDLDDLAGYVHIKDLVKSGLMSDQIDVASILRPPTFIPENASALKTLSRFRDTGVHVAFVVDEYGGLVGLITLNDILTALLGEIAPAQSTQEPLVVKRADGSYLLDGMLPIDQLVRLMGIAPEQLPKRDLGDFDTLGGFVMTYLARIPHTGDSFAFDRYVFEIVDMDRTRVDKVMLSMADGASPEAQGGPVPEA
jgi:putative hemolysin